MSAPLTLGTAGHVDHGKTTLVQALTGTWTDRLPEERARGLTIALGYARLPLPSGRALSLVDVPGHERFVRTMVAGATGVDLFLLVVAADDGVMPQTREHLAVLRALDVPRGVVAVTKADAAEPARALAEVAELLPGVPAVACSARTGAGLDALRDALDACAAGVAGRAAAADGPVVLHVDRVFTVVGRGTVVTGTLWSGTVALGDRVEVAPSGRVARVRGIEVHDAPVARAAAGQRVALNLAGVAADEVARGDVVGAPGAIAERLVLDCALSLDPGEHGRRAQVHHGTRHAAARLRHLGEGRWRLRLERPLLARDGDRVVVRRHAPPDTLGGGIVLPSPAPVDRGVCTVLPPAMRDAHTSVETGAMEAQLRDAGLALVSEAQAEDPAALRALREAGVAVRVSGRLHAHADVLRRATAAVVDLIAARGSVSLAEVRDEVAGSRKAAQALLEHLDAQRVTRRGADDRRTLRARDREPA